MSSPAKPPWKPDPMFLEAGWENEVGEVPPHVFTAKSLHFDEAIRSRYSGRAPRVREELRHTAIPFGRRALATAIRSAASAPKANTPREQWEGGWQELERSARAAGGALEALLAALHPPLRPGRQRPRIYVGPLRQSRHGGRRTRDLFSLQDRARRDVALLVAAQRVAHRIEADAARHRAHLTADLPSQVLIEKLPFVSIMAEAWMFLVGRWPGSSPTANPFDDFVHAGWMDWKGEGKKDETVSFVEARREWAERPRDASILEHGPSWAPILWRSPIRTETEPMLHDLWGS